MENKNVVESKSYQQTDAESQQRKPKCYGQIELKGVAVSERRKRNYWVNITG